MKKSILLFCTLGIILILQSCTRENEPTLQAPDIPSVSLFTIPVVSFDNIDAKETSETRTNKSNWIHAGLNVLVWNSVVFTNTAVPIAAFGKALDHEPQFIGDKSWVWKYDYTTLPGQGSKKYEVALTGQISDDDLEVYWTMNIIDHVNNKQFTWYEGTIDKENTVGNFTFYKDPNTPIPYMNISFEKLTSSDDLTIRFSNVLAGEQGFGDYIEWRTNNGNKFDRAYDVLTNNSLLQIEANSITDHGRVKHELHFNDNKWHCWDSNHYNANCD